HCITATPMANSDTHPKKHTNTKSAAFSSIDRYPYRCKAYKTPSMTTTVLPHQETNCHLRLCTGNDLRLNSFADISHSARSSLKAGCSSTSLPHLRQFRVAIVHAEYVQAPQ